MNHKKSFNFKHKKNNCALDFFKLSYIMTILLRTADSYGYQLFAFSSLSILWEFIKHLVQAGSISFPNSMLKVLYKNIKIDIYNKIYKLMYQL